MQKPLEKGHFLLPAHADENSNDLSTSEMSIPKGQIQVMIEHHKTQTSKNARKEEKQILNTQNRIPSPKNQVPASFQQPVSSLQIKQKPVHTRAPSEQIKFVDKILMQPSTVKNALLKPQKMHRSPPTELNAISYNSLSPSSPRILADEHISVPGVTLPSKCGSVASTSSSRMDKPKQFLSNKIKPKQFIENCEFCVNQYSKSKNGTRSLEDVIKEQLYKKYEATTQNTYNVNVVNDIILNANTRIVAIFKEYLIYDDLTEFMKASYLKKEANAKLKQLVDFYDKSSKVFPNFIALEEKKYMFKNIERKQKAIDTRHRQQQENLKKNKDKNNNLFTRKFLEEITMRCSRIVNEKTNLIDLVDNFISKDSMSQINHSNCESIEATFCALKGVQKGNVIEEIQKMIEAVKKKPKVVPITSSKRTIGEPVPSKKLLKEEKTKHCQSQEEIIKNTLSTKNSDKPKQKFVQGLLSGRMSAAGNYCSNNSNKEFPLGKELLSPKARKPERNMKQMQSNQNVKLPTSAKLAMGDIDPLQININLNLVLNKEKSRCTSPSTCTAADIYCFKNLEKLHGNLASGMVTSRAYNPSMVSSRPPLSACAGKKNSVGMIQQNAKSTANLKIEQNKKSARSTTRPRQQDQILKNDIQKVTHKIERVQSNTNLLAGTKLTGNRPESGRASAVPFQKKKVAIDQLCKNIKDLLGPSQIMEKVIIPAVSRHSPKKDKFYREKGGKVISAPPEKVNLIPKNTFLQRKSEAEIPVAFIKQRYNTKRVNII